MKYASCLILIMLSPCTLVRAYSFDSEAVIQDPAPTRFSICYNHGCENADTIGLNHSEWQAVQTIFKPSTKNATEEQDRIAQAIALIEQITGNMVGTSNDKGGNLEGMFEQKQMDCIDESTNTNTYLVMMENDGLLKWHKVEEPSTRYPSITSWPHTSAVIRELETNQKYVVDSWFFDNGKAPAIVKLETWKDGWRPEGF